MTRATALAALLFALAGCPGNFIEGSGRDLDDSGAALLGPLPDAGRRDSGVPDAAGAPDGG